MSGELDRVRKTLRELGKTIENFPADPAPRKVHQLRTASRRLESMAVLLDSPKKSRRLLKSIEPVRKAAGCVRDMDVLVGLVRKLRRYGSGASLARLLGHLETSRQQYATELARVLDHRHETVLNELKEYSKLASSTLKHASPSPTPLHERLLSAAMPVMRELGAWRPLEAGNLHDFRLKIKHLRYTLQMDDDADPILLSALDEVQHHIGNWHDWQQLAEVAREVLIHELDGPFLARIDRIAESKLDRAITTANGLRGKYLASPMAQYI